MEKRFFLCEDNLVLLKKQLGQIWQYSFLGNIWYTIPALNGIENHPELFNEITEEEANDYINAVNRMIENKKRFKNK